jgi:dienelactone hydrolase
MAVPIQQLPRYRFPDSPTGREVITVGDDGSDRQVVLLHELGGLSQSTADYGATLADCGYLIHLPVIFGSVGQGSPAKGAAQLCWGRHIALLLSNRRPRMASWLGDLCDHLAASAGRPVVVIGMCATGGVVFSVLMRDSVGGAVAAQPSMPYRPPWSQPGIGALGSTAADVEASAASDKPLAALRYEKDVVCPAGRLARIGDTFGDASVRTVPGNGHSTLVFHPNAAAKERVLELLAEVFGPSDRPR